MSSDTAAAAKQTSDDNTVESGVGHSEISNPNTQGTGDGADPKGEDPSHHPEGESGTSSSREEGEHDSAAAEHGSAHYAPRGPPNRPAHGGPRPVKR